MSEKILNSVGRIDIDSTLPQTASVMRELNDPATFNPVWRSFIKDGNVIHDKYSRYRKTTLKGLKKSVLATTLGAILVTTIAFSVATSPQVMGYVSNLEKEAYQKMLAQSVIEPAEAIDFISAIPLFNVDAKDLPKDRYINDFIESMAKGFDDPKEMPSIVKKGLVFEKNGKPSYIEIDDDVSKGYFVTVAVNSFNTAKWAAFVFRKNSKGQWIAKSFNFFQETITIPILNKDGTVDKDAFEQAVALQNKAGAIRDDAERQFAEQAKLSDVDINEQQEALQKSINELRDKQTELLKDKLSLSTRFSTFRQLSAVNDIVTLKTILDSI